MSKIPSDDILESLYTLRTRQSDQLKIVFVLYNMVIHQKISMPNYQTLKTLVRRSIDQKLRLRNFDASHEKMKQVQWLQVGGDQVVLKGDKGCYQWEAKGHCSRGDQCSFRHDGYERAKPTPKTAPPSEPPTQRGESARTSEAVGPSGKTNRQPCRNFLKGACTKLPCDSWHPPECQIL